MLPPNPLSEPPQQSLLLFRLGAGGAATKVTYNKKRKFNMTNERDNRILGRIGARELSDQETQNVHGGLRTGALCSAPSPAHPNGDGLPQDCGV